MNFKVGEEVLCVKGYTEKGCVASIQGEEYPVLAVLRCACGIWTIDIGTRIPTYISGTKCPKCEGADRSNIWWQNPKRFVRKSSASFADEILNSIVKEVEISI